MDKDKYIEQLKYTKQIAHEYVRSALGVNDAAPYRFDFYASEIEKLRSAVKDSQTLENAIYYAAQHLPDRTEVVIRVENGAATVYAVDNRSISSTAPLDCGGDFVEEFNQAVKKILRNKG